MRCASGHADVPQSPVAAGHPTTALVRCTAARARGGLRVEDGAGRPSDGGLSSRTVPPLSDVSGPRPREASVRRAAVQRVGTALSALLSPALVRPGVFSRSRIAASSLPVTHQSPETSTHKRRTHTQPSRHAPRHTLPTSPILYVVRGANAIHVHHCTPVSASCRDDCFWLHGATAAPRGAPQVNELLMYCTQHRPQNPNPSCLTARYAGYVQSVQ